MLDPKKLEEVVQAITKLMPASFTEMQQDVEKNIRAALSATFAKLDLVTRQEFDVQTQVLHRTRSKLEALEQRVAELEQVQRVAELENNN
ncbi:MAG: accessory factor UbiK family protein [Gammaproteobacteria bacterium]|nr:accessory factor UbiK family protein [Gammaproteobacteria bacterium]